MKQVATINMRQILRREPFVIHFSNRVFCPLFSFFFLCMCFSARAQSTAENCTNGIDDDGDGLIDCYDQDCTCTGQCDDFYYTTCNADCFFIPRCDSIQLGIQWIGEAETGTYSPLVAGDMDRDGVPEIVTYKVEDKQIYIIDGATGRTKLQIDGPTTYPGGTAPAIADLDGDGFGELILIGNDRRVRCFEHTGEIKYSSAIQVGYHPGYNHAVPNIADFDHDGLPEVSVGNQVFNGQTGALLAGGNATMSAGEHPARVSNNRLFSFCSTVAIDALPDNFCPDCEGLEIVAGNQVLSVNLVSGQVRPVVTAPAGFSDGYTSVADFDLDGDLDAIVQGQKNGYNTVYCWEIETPTVIRQFALDNNHPDGASRVNIADLDGDGQLEISFVSFPTLYALDTDFSVIWRSVTLDNSSITSSSVFDFCGDGSSDVIYRGETFLQVLEGATGKVKWQDNCLSATHIENPLVLDVDADGQTEIVIECGTNGLSTTGTVVCYEAVGAPGIASRKVWNQHAYFNTNINDDLSVPRRQQSPHLIGDRIKMNSFLNQYFNPTFPSPDGVLTYTGVQCLRDSFEIGLRLCNNGDNLIGASTPLAVYRKNPEKIGAVWLATVSLGFDLEPDSCRNFSIRAPRTANDSIFVVFNDDHSIPVPFSLKKDFPSTNLGECSFTNNVVKFYYAYNPTTLNLGKDTAICANTTFQLNAAGQDQILFQWQNGATLSSITAPGAGLYAVTTTDICGIEQTDQIRISIDSSTIVSLGPDRTMCAGERVTLSESGFDTYAWSPANAVDCSTCASAKAGPAKSGNIVLTASFKNGCTNRDTVFVTVYDTFNIKIDTTVCFGRNVRWNGADIAPGKSRVFNLQSFRGCDSTVTVFVKGTPTGTFIVKVDTAVCLGTTLNYNNLDFKPGDLKTFLLTASTGCDSTVLLNVSPKDTFSTAESRTVCAGDTASIFGAAVGVSGIYQKVFAAVNGCDSTHRVNLTVLPPIVLKIDETPACVNEANGVLKASATGAAPPFGFVWNTAATTPAISQLSSGTYSVTVTDANDCTETAEARLPNHPPIEFETAVDSVRCYGEKNGVLRLLARDSTLIFALEDETFALQRRFGGLKAGDYTVYAQDVFGCVDTLTVGVPEPPEFVIALPADTTLRLGDSLRLTIGTTTVRPLIYAWRDTSWLSCAQCPEPVARPFVSHRYRLSATDSKGCTASDEMILTVLRVLDVFVPNAFAPNAGSDNDLLTPGFGPAIQKVLLFQVFDRWGNLAHHVRNAAPDDRAAAWDGQYDGKMAAPGVYGWIMEVELIDGRVERLKGDVTVVR
jgi:CHU_C Type IX secretion signal domain/FG-GAP-like repeat